MKLSKIPFKTAALAAGLLLGACQNNQPHWLLPVLGEKQLQGEDTVYHRIKPFALLNQYGDTVTQKTIEGKLVVANFFFATCQSICPEMSTNLVDVQKAFVKDDSLLILSHSVNPLHDTVEVLKNYAGTYGAMKNKWHLLTGNKAMIYDLAKTSYLVNAFEDDGSPEGFLHSEMLLLLDSKGRLRGTYDGTDKAQVQNLIRDIHILKKEDHRL